MSRSQKLQQDVLEYLENNHADYFCGIGICYSGMPEYRGK